MTGAGWRPSRADEDLDAFYARRGDDPWGVEHRWYEERKRALTLASLPRRRFARALEAGCSTGRLTAELAERCDAVVGTDAAERPLALAAERLAGPVAAGRVELRRARLPGGFPEGAFDLVVLSEVGYFLDPDDLADLARRSAAALGGHGVLLACHWRHGGPASGEPGVMGGDRVHEVLRAASGLALLAGHVEEDFRLEVLVPAPARSVARAEGLLG